MTARLMSNCATVTGNREAFDALLARVEQAAPDVLPGQGLLTTVAKRRGARLQQLRETIFQKDSPS